MSDHIKRDADGIIGLKCLKVCCICPTCHQVVNNRDETPTRFRLFSPLHGVEWGNTLTAKNWSNEKAVRGMGGIHACWPWSLDELLSYSFDQDDALVELRGFGDTVQGDLGWRSEHAMLKKIWVRPAYIDIIKQQYEAEVAHLDAWMTQFFLTRTVSEECNSYALLSFLGRQIHNIRPAFLREVYLSYRGPHQKMVRDSAYQQYNTLQSKGVICELEL